MKNKVLLSGLLPVASGAYLMRRLGQRWGATNDELHQSIPGDELIPHPMMETTHAITVKASAAEICPWLVQLGIWIAEAGTVILNGGLALNFRESEAGDSMQSIDGFE